MLREHDIFISQLTESINNLRKAQKAGNFLPSIHTWQASIHTWQAPTLDRNYVVK